MKHFIFALTALTMLSCSQEAPRNVAELLRRRPLDILCDAGVPPLPGRLRRLRHSDAELPRILFGRSARRRSVRVGVERLTTAANGSNSTAGRDAYSARVSRRSPGGLPNPRTIRPTKIEFLPREEADTVAVGDVRFYERDREEAWAVSSIPRWISRCLTHRPRVPRFTPRWCRIPGRMSATTPARLPKYFSTQLPIR